MNPHWCRGYGPLTSTSRSGPLVEDFGEQKGWARQALDKSKPEERKKRTGYDVAPGLIRHRLKIHVSLRYCYSKRVP